MIFQSSLGHLHDLLTRPQIIHLHGFEFLKLKNVAHTIQQCVISLFFEAHIPCNWKINVRWNHPSHSNTDVHITLLNYIVKERVKSCFQIISAAIITTKPFILTDSYF
jgi:hypothetical protein